MPEKDLPQIGEQVPAKMESFPIISCSFITLQVKAAHECAQRVFRIAAVILRPSYLTLDLERNKYRPDIGSQRCGGPSCCLTSNPVDVACSLVQGGDVYRSPSLGGMLFSTEFVARWVRTKGVVMDTLIMFIIVMLILFVGGLFVWKKSQ